ncbi:hypothetical protein [Hymenobacter terrenus]|nr:hypothetical protein [Hymenobacter terrenus]
MVLLLYSHAGVGASSLVPEGLYMVGSDATAYHSFLVATTLA